jgi:uncharacterized protein (UPF0332 family)
MSRVRTGGRAEAQSHLDKAREFLDAARAALEARWHNAAALDRLLGQEDRAQYDSRSVTASDAQAAVRCATVLVEAAERALAR